MQSLTLERCSHIHYLKEESFVLDLSLRRVQYLLRVARDITASFEVSLGQMSFFVSVGG